MSETFRTALSFLINTLFDLYLFILVVRVILAWVGAGYYQPIVQFIIKLTDFLIKPLRRVLPNYRGIEVSTLIIIFAIEIVRFFLVALISYGTPNIGGLIILAFGDILKLFINAFFYAILLQAIISWVQPYSPVSNVLNQFTAPIMRPIQRLVPPVGGFDISPIPALILLQLLMIVLVGPMLQVGLGLAFGS